MILPFLIMATLLQSFSATSSTCVEKNIAEPLRHISLMISFRMKDALGSSPTKGSSSTISLGSWIRAEMIATFCFIPCEYEPIMSPRESVISNMSAYFFILSSRSAALISNTSATKFRYWIPVRFSYRSGLSGIYAVTFLHSIGSSFTE